MERVAAAIPMPVYRSLFPRDVLHFFYHAVSEKPLRHLRHLYPCKTPEMFEEDLVFLKKNFRLITYQQLVEHVESKKRLPSRAAMLSFDDGLAECYTAIRPLLLKYHLPAIFFVTTGVLDNGAMLYRHKISLCIEKANLSDHTLRLEAFAKLSHQFGLVLSGMEAFITWIRGLKDADHEMLQAACDALEVDVPGYLQAQRPYLASDQLKQLKSDGFAIGAHSVSHIKFNLLDEASMESELLNSCLAVQQLSGEPRVPFAFPFSASGVDRDAIQRILDRNPVAGLVFDTKGIKKDASFLFNRIWSDVPAPRQKRVPDLLGHLKSAYEDNFLWKMRRLKLYSGNR